MSELRLQKNDDGYWLVIKGETQAMISIVSTSPMVLKAMDEAIEDNELDRLHWKPVSENPPEDGLYEIMFEGPCSIEYDHEFYDGNEGWATEKNIIYWRVIPEVE